MADELLTQVKFGARIVVVASSGIERPAEHVRPGRVRSEAFAAAFAHDVEGRPPRADALIPEALWAVRLDSSRAVLDEAAEKTAAQALSCLNRTDRWNSQY